MTKIRKHLLGAGGIFWGLFLIYGLTVARLPVNYADSDDLTNAAVAFGLGHPPGYPFLILLLQPILWLVPDNKMVVALNLANAALQAGAGSLMFLVLVNLGKIFRFKHIFLWSVIGSVAWSLGWFTWFQTTTLEVFGFGHLLFLSYLLLAVKVYKTKSNLILLGLLGGAAIFYHQLLLLVVVPTILFVVGINWQQMIKLTTGTLLGIILSFMSYLPFSLREANYGWPIEPSLSGLWLFFSRQVLAANGSAVETYAGFLNIEHSLKSLQFLAEFLVYELSWVGLAGFLLGIYFLVKLKQKFGFWFLTILALAGPGMVWYMKFPLLSMATEIEYFWGTALRIRMLFILVTMGYLVMTIGWGFLLAKLNKPIWALGLLALLVGVRVGITYPKVDAKEVNFSHEYTSRILTSLPQEAVLVVNTDMVFGLLTQQTVYGIRPDIAIVPTEIVVQPSVWKNSKGNLYAWENDPENQMAHLVSYSLLMGKRVFLYSPEPSLLAFLGSQGDPFFAAPYGYTLEISRTMPELLLTYDYGLSKQMAEYKTERFDWWVKGERAHLAGIHTQLAYYYARLGFTDLAKTHAELSQKLFMWQKSRETVRATQAAAEADYAQNGSYIAYKPLLYETYLDLGKKAEGDSVHYFLTRAMLLNPLRPEAWEALGYSPR